jgi:hypothetical protein
MSIPSVFTGTAAGAVGTAVLNIATYADMVWRARPASETPSKLVKILAAQAGIEPLAAEGEEADNRRSGAGALLGYVNGLGVGFVYGAVRPALRDLPVLVAGLLAGAAAMALSDVPAVKAGATDPSTWGTEGWIADIVPHALYGIALALAFDALDARE